MWHLHHAETCAVTGRSNNAEMRKKLHFIKKQAEVQFYGHFQIFRFHPSSQDIAANHSGGQEENK